MSSISREYVLKRVIVDVHTGCWLCPLKPTPEGYVALTIRDPSSVGAYCGVYIHRLAYELWVGPIPDDAEIRHVCPNRNCCNPEHLECGLKGENILWINANKTHCIRGHAFDAQNTRIEQNGSRACRICERIRYKERNPFRGEPISKINANKTHCLRGHPFDEQNTRICSNGGRKCRECERILAKKYKTK